jgi:hypothetical protein
MDKQAAAAGVGDLAAFRERLLQPQGGAGGAGGAAGTADGAAAAEALLAAAVEDARDAGGRALPPELLTRLAAMGSPVSAAAGGAAGSARSGAASPASAQATPRRAPLVQEMPEPVRTR